MTFDQGLACGIILVTMVLFIWGRPRYDIVACLSLLAAVAAGLVQPEDAFSGFSDDIVIIVAGALVVSGAIAQTGIAELALQRISRHVTSVQAQVLVLVATVIVLSAFVKNVGALAIMIPIAFQMARRAGAAPSCYLMPMSFGALLGGLMTQIGTSPNIIVSRLRGELVGTPFSMFDFTPVGIVLAVVGLLFLVVAYRFLPVRTRATASLDEALAAKKYVTEAEVTETAAVLGKTVADLQDLAHGEANRRRARQDRRGPAGPGPWRREGHRHPEAGRQACHPLAGRGARARRHGDPGRRSAGAGAGGLARQADARIRPSGAGSGGAAGGDRQHRGGDRRQLAADRPVGAGERPLRALRRQSAGRQPVGPAPDRAARHHLAAIRRRDRAAGQPRRPAGTAEGAGLPAAGRSVRCGWAARAARCCRCWCWSPPWR